MPLQPGALLGPYEVISPAGAGGMGEVYKARDTRLDRTVAIKILTANLASTPDLKQRFEREARAISALQHPHICTLYDVGSQDGVEYLVMEFLEGETLSARLEKGALPIQQVMKVGAEIADALDRAHRQGILHRDLKPGNVMLTKSGAKLMDFGLAKPTLAMSAASGAALTAALTRSSPASPITQAGTIVGTFQYMSPEQLEGKEADPRSDIFALGAVLYEMATGKRAFEGKSQISVMSAILEKEPEPVSSVQPTAPPAFDHLVNRALAKDPDERWQTAADVRSELKWISQTTSTAQAVMPGKKSKRIQKWLMPVAVGVLALAVGALAIFFFGPKQLPLQAFLLPPESSQFAFTGQGSGPPVISADGTKVVFAALGEGGRRFLYLKDAQSLNAQQIPGTEAAQYPFFSPDGKQIAFFRSGKLCRVDVTGGPVTALADVNAGRGGSWNSDGVIIFSPGTADGIWKISAAGGTATQITKVQLPETSHRWPFFLPDGKRFLYLAWNQAGQDSGAYSIFASSLDSDMRQLAVSGGTNPAYSDGHIFFVRNASLYAQKLDPRTLKVEGEAKPLFDRIQEDPQFGRSNYSVSQTGTLIYAIGPSASDSRLEWLGPDGRSLGQIAGSGNWAGPRISPDGKTLAVGSDPGNQDVWLVSLTREMKSRLTFDTLAEGNPIWSPDGKRIAFSRIKTGGNKIVVKAADGSGSEEVLLERTESIQPADWSRDGKYLTFNLSVPGQRTDLWVLPLFGDRKPFPLLATPFGESDAMFSPDGNWIAYDSNVSGSSEIYAMPFPGPGGKFQISSGGGDWPRWTRDGKHVIYMDGDQFFMADVEYDKSSLRVTASRKIFSSNFVGTSQSYFYDVAPDGRIVMVVAPTRVDNQRLAWISDWKRQLSK